MGWLFSDRWQYRSDLIKHLTEGNGLKTLKHCTVGNNLWCVHEYERRPGVFIRFICLYMMKGPHNCSKDYTGSDKDWWGYKDVDETAGPYELTCPVSYLEMCTAPDNHWAYEWRQRVYARGRKARSIKIGSKWQWGDKIVEVIKRRSPSSFLVRAGEWETYRCSLGTLLRMDPV